YGFMYYYAPYKGTLKGIRTYVVSTKGTIAYTLKKGDTVLETGSFNPVYTGFVSHTLSGNYSIAKGDLLSLMLDYNSKGVSGGNKVPLESQGYGYEPEVKEGFNFVSTDGSNWTDCKTLGRNLGAGLLVKQEIAPKTITLNDTDVNIEKGKTLELTATVKPDNAIYPSLKWVIKNTSVVKGEPEGFGEKIKLTALKPGETTITVYPDGYSNVYATCNVYVYAYVTGISVSPTSKTIKAGESFTIKPTVYPTDATNQNVTWSSSDTSVATVDEGKVTGVSKGEATITCKTIEGGFTATCKVTVTDETVKVTGVTLDKTELTMKKGANKVLTATVKPSNATNKEVTWTSSDKEVAYVNASGKVSAYKAGVATITVKTKDGGYKATCKVTVTQPVTGIKLSKSSLTMVVADEVKITATVKPEDATNKDVVWSSSDTTIAKVNNGKITAKGKGKATITATSVDCGFKATCEVTVNKGVKVTGITLDRTTLTLGKGQAKILTPTITPANATNQEVRWSSSNKSVAGVGSNGKVSAYAPGTATIICTTRNGGLKATCKVTVVIYATGVTLNKTSYEMSKGKTVTLKATVKPSNATNKKVTWKSSKTSVATVDSSGNVTAVAKGTATITVTTKDGGYKATCKITVN
ncbi:MAG: Ig-like domain-containing protein, partial [Lachnospiraceae bacterium]|nr:Ig-like domain-containing protein [Lachnospiraceae bacterium]